MALKITDTTQTNRGATGELYFHVTEYYRNKAGQGIFTVQYYINENSYRNGEEPVDIFEGALKKVYNIDLSDVVNTDKLEKLVYNKIAALIKNSGVNIHGDGDGNQWVQY